MLQLSQLVSKVKDSMTDIADMLSSLSFKGEDDDASGNQEEDLEIDDTLGALEKIRRYINSDLILHRLYLVRELSEYAKEVGYEDTVSQLLPYLKEIQRDVEPVIRQALVEQIPHIAAYLFQEGKEAALDTVVQALLPIVAHFTRDVNSQVRLSSTESVVSIASALAKPPLGGPQLLSEHIFPIITTLGKDTTQEEYRVEAAQLVHHLAPIMGPELCVEFALPLLLKLSEDTFRVRKAVAGRIGNIAQAVPKEVISRELVPLFVKMADDEIWGVRKACAESLVALSESITAEERASKLIPIFEKLVDDTSRWVRSAAFQNLGRFIATFEGRAVTPELLQLYNGMVAPTAATKYGDAEIVNYCAFDFPAVIYTIGRDRWGEVKATYEALVKDLQWKVRRPLAHALHEVAAILGQELTEKDLCPFFELFMKDLDEVKVGVVKHISEFLSVLSEASREKYLPLVCDITNETSNWRFRKLMARQLGKLSALYSAPVVNKHLVPISLQLCQDAVSGVRKAAYMSVGPLMRRVAEGDQRMRDEYVEQIVAFASTFPDTSYLDRQMYVNICGAIVDDVSPEYFVETFLPHLFALAIDKVPNVRVAVSQVVAKLYSKDAYKGRKDVGDMLAKLTQDRDRDVRYYATSAIHAEQPQAQKIEEEGAV